MPKYGDKTAKELDNYLKNYQSEQGKTRTGLVAPAKDMFRNYNTMKEMKLKESDSFFTVKQIMKQQSEVAYMVQVLPILLM